MFKKNEVHYILMCMNFIDSVKSKMLSGACPAGQYGRCYQYYYVNGNL